MKARELIIGDLVRIIEPDKYHGAICRIVSLIDHKDDECAYFKVFVLTKGNILHEVCNEDIEPIPLTSAILEKNGFRNDNPEFVFRNESVLVKIRLGMFCKFDITTDECYYATNNIIHVNELQHALRLCGLDGLADNFKI